eukprot:14088424-Alexandrium_andersonii.AAC.1
MPPVPHQQVPLKSEASIDLVGSRNTSITRWALEARKVAKPAAPSAHRLPPRFGAVSTAVRE